MEAAYWELLYEELHRAGWNLGWKAYIIVDVSYESRILIAEAADLNGVFWKLYCLAESSRN